MPFNNYIRLVTSDGSKDKKFKVVFGAFAPLYEKRQTVGETLTGRVDTQEGSHPTTHHMTLLVKKLPTGTHPDGADWGVYEDLFDESGGTGFFDLNNPNGTPSNQITYIDHEENEHTIIILGPSQPQLITPSPSGENSYWYVPLVFRKTS